MNIPYTIERRADTGVNNVTLGMWLFLASEAMLFGGLFSAYVLLRSGSLQWAADAGVSAAALGWLNTAVLLVSSVAMTIASRSAAAGLERRARALLGVTALLGVLFLAVKGFEYAAKLQSGLLPGTSTYLALYFLLTAVHGLHVLGGVVANAHFALSGTCATGGSMPRFANRVAASALYWHFVDVIWLGLFVLLYLL